MLVMPDCSTLIVAESYARRLTAFDLDDGGSLSDRRVWADLGDGVPDGICADAQDAVWYADLPNKRCVRVREGGEILQTPELDRGCFACALGGTDGTTLFMVAQEWHGPEGMFTGPHRPCPDERSTRATRGLALGTRTRVEHPLTSALRRFVVQPLVPAETCPESVNEAECGSAGGCAGNGPVRRAPRFPQPNR
jgi:SMP-30/Gluconolactonase/LRE-like region